MLCAFSAHIDGLEVEPQNRKCDGTYPSHTPTRHNPSWFKYLKKAGPCRLSAYLPVGLYRASQRGPLLEECLLPAVHKSKTLDAKVVRPTAHLRVIPQTSLLAVCLSDPGLPSAGLGFGDQAEPGFGASHQPDVASAPIQKPRCTYYLGACLEQGKATRLKQDPRAGPCSPTASVALLIASKHLETLLTGACETFSRILLAENLRASLLPGNPGHILGHTDSGVGSSSIPSIG